jgi:hypothetical protein
VEVRSASSVPLWLRTSDDPVLVLLVLATETPLLRLSVKTAGVDEPEVCRKLAVSAEERELLPERAEAVLR